MIKKNKSFLDSLDNRDEVIDIWWQGVKQSQHGKKIRGVTDFHRCNTLELYGHNFDLIRLKLSHIYESPNGINREIAKLKAVSQAMKPVDFSWIDVILIQAA